MGDSRWPMIPRTRLRMVAVGLSCLIAGVSASLALGPFLNFNSSGTTGADSSKYSLFWRYAPNIPCDQQEPSAVGLLGRLAPGATSESLLSAGYKAVQAIDGAESDLVVITPATGGVVSGDDVRAVEQVQSLPYLRSVGFVRHATRDPALRSCFYRLEDKAAAREIAARASAWMVANEVLTQDQVDAGGTTFQLAEDPTKPEHLFFTVLLATPGGGIPGSADAGSLTSYVATIDKASGVVLTAGLAHW